MKAALMVFALVLSANAAEQATVSKLSADSRARVSGDARTANVPLGFELVVPQLIIGGEWTSTLKLINRGTAPIPPSDVFFFDNTGQLMPASYRTSNGELVTDVGFVFQLPADAGILEITFSGTGSGTQFGHAQIQPGACPFEDDCTLYGEITLKNSHPSRPDFESVFPIEQGSRTQYLLWDHRDGYSSTLYLVNATLGAAEVKLEFLDADDVLMATVTVQMQEAAAEILVPHVLVPDTIGRHGSITITATSSEAKLPDVVITALRINPTNSFTPVRAFETKWF